MSNITDDRLLLVINSLLLNGVEKTKEDFKISEETIGRYKREYRARTGQDVDKALSIFKLRDQLSDRELQMIAGSNAPGEMPETVIDFNGEVLRLGVLSDTHIGHKCSKPNDIKSAIEEMNRSEVDLVFHAGDVTEGLCGRKGHYLELSEIGYNPQKEKAIEIFSLCNSPIYAVSGNHDDWYMQDNNSQIVKDIASNLDNFNFIGFNSAVIDIKGVKIELFHGLDGNSYAISYRMQKYIESLQSGSKPAIALFGHTHKAAYIFDRNVHCLSAGCIQRQTPFMKGKKIAAHCGFWIVETKIRDGQVISFKPEFFPIY